MVDEEVTIEVLKEKIAEKLNLSSRLDLLQSDRGPSIEAKSQLKKTKTGDPVQIPTDTTNDNTYQTGS